MCGWKKGVIDGATESLTSGEHLSRLVVHEGCAGRQPESYLTWWLNTNVRGKGLYLTYRLNTGASHFATLPAGTV
jgi:hypothetical protein